MNHRRERRHTVEIMQIACVGASGLGVAMAERWRSVSASSALAVMPIVMPTGTNSGETQRTATDRQSSILARWRTVADAYEEGTAHPYALPPLALTLVVGAFVLPLLPLPAQPVAGSIRWRRATAGQPVRRPGRLPRRARAPESTPGTRVVPSRPRPRGRRRGSARTPPG